MNNSKIEPCAKRIVKAMSLRDMKQVDLCTITGIPKSAMSQYIKGSFEPKQDRVFLMAKALNVSEAWLMGYDVPMEKEQKNISTNELPLTDGEKMMLELFRKIPEEHQPQALEMLRVALKMQKKL